MRISDWSSDVCSSDLGAAVAVRAASGSGGARDAAALDACLLVDRRDRACRDVERAAHGTAGRRARLLRLALGGRRIAVAAARGAGRVHRRRSEEHTSELQPLMRISYAVFCLKKNNKTINQQ